MPKNITSVVWSASNLPSGLSFDTATGTFSGTPTTAGEYTVPVTVRTNYGEDTKDVVITVKKKMYTSCFFTMYQKQYLTGETLAIDMHDYVRGFGVDEPVSLSDDGVTSLHYSIRGVNNISDGNAELLEELNDCGGFNFNFDPQTGIITIIPNSTVYLGTEWIALCIKTNLGESIWVLRVGYNTKEAPDDVKNRGIFVDVNGVWIAAYIENGEVCVSDWKE